MFLLRLTFALWTVWHHFLQCYAVTIFLRRYLDIANVECVNCTESVKSRNWISIVMELIFSSSSWLITECQPEPRMETSWCSGFRSEPLPYVDSQGCRRWVPVSKTAMSLSQIESDDQNAGLCAPLWKQYLETWKPALCFLLDNIGSSSNASCSQTSICGKQTYYKWR